MEKHEELLVKLEKHSRQQARLTKILCVLCAAVLVCSLIMTAAVAGAASQLTAVVEPLQDVASQVQNVAVQVQDMSGQAEIIMDNMETVTQALADADLGTMVGNVNTLTEESQDVVAEAMEKLIHIKKVFPAAFIVKEKIKFPEVDKAALEDLPDSLEVFKF